MRYILVVLCTFTMYFSQALALTVEYQPTPYPLKKYDGTPMPQDVRIIHMLDGWVPSVYYGRKFIQDKILKLGGWADEYRIYMKFDVTGLPSEPKVAMLRLTPYDVNDSSTPVEFKLCQVADAWTPSSLTWDTQPNMADCWGWYTPPVPWKTKDLIITLTYDLWKKDPSSNNGLMFKPKYTNNKFDVFRSSRFASIAERPKLQFEIEPTFMLKMPLPGGHRWLVTKEVGGYQCLGTPPWPDKHHQDATKSYFSIDFSWRNVLDGSSTVFVATGNIPILAAADGLVYEAAYSPENGYYVIIDHDGDGDINTGFSTRYLHLKNAPFVYKGNVVQQGERVGYMGNISTNIEPQLHFEVRYNNDGSSTVPELTKVVMDGRLLKGYQTECMVDYEGTPIDMMRYYASHNTLY